MKFYWRFDDTLIMSHDTETGEFKGLTNNNPAVVAASTQMLGINSASDISFGGLVLLGDGNLLVSLSSQLYNQFGTQQQAGITVTPDLVPTGDTWETYSSGYWGRQGDVFYLEESGVYRPETGLNWLARSHGDDTSTPWSWYGYDNDGNFIRGLFDTSQLTSYGSGYIGDSSQYGVNAAYMNGELWRETAFGDGMFRVDMTTEAAYGVFPESVAGAGTGYANRFVGCDETTGKFITVRSVLPSNSYYDPSRPWGSLEVRDPASVPWTDVIAADGLLDPASQLGLPEASFAPAVEYPAVMQTGSHDIRIHEGKAYYAAENPSGTYGVLDGTYYGNSVSFYSTDLTTGAHELVFQVPYMAYRSDGTATLDANDPGWSSETYIGNMAGITIVTGARRITHAPPLRQTRRNDGMRGSARSLRATSRQRSLRRGPGAIL